MKFMRNSGKWQHGAKPKWITEPAHGTATGAFSSGLEKTFQPLPTVGEYLQLSAMPAMTQPVAVKQSGAPYPLLPEFFSCGKSQASCGTISIEKKYNNQGGSWFNLSFSQSFAMGCCGAGTMQGLSGVVAETDKEFCAAALYTHLRGVLTYYGITASYQQKEGPDSLLNFLKELGLREVHKSPNRNHGPHDMHLMVWDPKDKDTKAGFGKYVDLTSGVPLSILKLSKEEQQSIYNKWNLIADEQREKEAVRIRANIQKTRADQISAFEGILYMAEKDLGRDVKQISPENLKLLNDVLTRYGYVKHEHTPIQPTQQTDVQTVQGFGFAQNRIW